MCHLCQLCGLPATHGGGFVITVALDGKRGHLARTPPFEGYLSWEIHMCSPTPAALNLTVSSLHFLSWMAMAAPTSMALYDMTLFTYLEGQPREGRPTCRLRNEAVTQLCLFLLLPPLGITSPCSSVFQSPTHSSIPWKQSRPPLECISSFPWPLLQFLIYSYTLLIKASPAIITIMIFPTIDYKYCDHSLTKHGAWKTVGSQQIFVKQN